MTKDQTQEIRTRLMEEREFTAMSKRPINPFLPAAALFAILLTIAGADELRLPVGDPDQGLKALVNLRCIHCHTIKNTPIQDGELGKRLDLTLGAELRFVRSYPDLITAITNPRHVVQKQYSQLLDPAQQAEAEPFMLDLTTTMTVRQLIDLVSFLDQIYAANLPTYKARH